VAIDQDGLAAAGVSMFSRARRFVTAAAMAPVVYELDELQRRLNASPEQAMEAA